MTADESAYRGRWVARLDGRIIAHGGTPSQAALQARLIYPRENLPVEYLPISAPLAFHPALQAILAAIPPDQTLYLVGGMVRDALLQRPSHDIDLLVPANAFSLGRQLARQLRAAFVPLDPQNDIARLVWEQPEGRLTIDLAAYRAPNLEEDLQARDFTINAIAYDPAQQTLFDPTGGLADLRAGIIRQCSPQSLQDDPLRALRAIRLAAQLGFRLDPATRAQLRTIAPQLPRVAAERIRDELLTILGGKSAHQALLALHTLGLIAPILPLTARQAKHTLNHLRHLEAMLAALAPQYDPNTASDFFNGLLVLRLGRYRQPLAEYLQTAFHSGTRRRSLLLLAALLPASAAGQQQAQALRLSKAELAFLHGLNQRQATFQQLVQQKNLPTGGQIYHFFARSHESGPGAILLALADLRARAGHALKQDDWAQALETARTLLEHYWEKPEQSVNPPHLLDGHTLMQAFNLPPGPRLGAVLQALKVAQADGHVVTRNDALQFVENWLEKNKETP